MQLEGKVAVVTGGGRVPLGRFLQPDEVARMALFIATEAGAEMTGQAINLDGGAAMW